MTAPKKIRIKDIAKMANVSEGTVDRVLHNRGEVSEETREHVLSIIKKLDYTPNLLAKSLASRKSIKIAVLIPKSDINSNYWDKPLEGIQKASGEISTFNVEVHTFFFDLGQEKTFVKAYKKILHEHFHGVIFNPLFQEASVHFIEELDIRKIPFILLDANLEDSTNLAYFGQNALQSGRTAARIMHLALKEKSRILVLKLVSGRSINLHLENRQKGFMSFFQSKSNQKNIEVIHLDIDINMPDEPEITFDHIFKKFPAISGIFVTNSKVHMLAQYIEQKGIADMFIGGYDLIHQNIDFMEKGIIHFLIGQKPEEQGYNSILAMFNYLNMQNVPSKLNYSPIDIVMIDNLEYYKGV